ncbi:MAG: hypothetical protein LIP28_06265, partial [Deltaproteobacteria bacterium]|nr:hypothetical protein [Deltaproteobacteria bacterium]
FRCVRRIAGFRGGRNLPSDTEAERSELPWLSHGTSRAKYQAMKAQAGVVRIDNAFTYLYKLSRRAGFALAKQTAADATAFF